MTRIVSNPARVWAFLRSRGVSVPTIAGMKGLGLESGDELVAGVLYEGYTQHNIWTHIAAVPGRRWMTRSYLSYIFHYPFIELGCRRISAWVEASNGESQRFVEHLGFQVEATLKGAARDGGDVLLYVMWRKDCRYVDPN